MMCEDVSCIILMKRNERNVTKKSSQFKKYTNLIAMTVVQADFIGVIFVNNNFITKIMNL